MINTGHQNPQTSKDLSCIIPFFRDSKIVKATKMGITFPKLSKTVTVGILIVVKYLPNIEFQNNTADKHNYFESMI